MLSFAIIRGRKPKRLRNLDASRWWRGDQNNARRIHRAPRRCQLEPELPAPVRRIKISSSRDFLPVLRGF
jgi:hypothetical protein